MSKIHERFPSSGRANLRLRHYLFSTLCLLAFVGLGCAGSSQPTTIVCGTCEELDRFVRLQTPSNPSSFGSQKGFSHPLKLSPGNWKLILKDIRVRPVGKFLMKRDEKLAFTSEEINYLSMTLSRAFAKASPEQWVVFGLSDPAPASGSEMTTGVWYVEKNMLNLLLPNLHAVVRMDNVRQVLSRDPLFEVLNATQYEFLPTEYADKISGRQSLLSFLSDETPHLAIDYERVLAESTSSRQAAAEEVVGDQSEGRDSPSSSLDERLATLKRLKAQDLITEEDYLKKN